MTPPPPHPPLPLPSSANWRIVTKITPAVTALAREVLASPLDYNETAEREIDGVRYLARIEDHYDDHAGGGLRWHRGVTVYEAEVIAATDPAPTCRFDTDRVVEACGPLDTHAAEGLRYLVDRLGADAEMTDVRWCAYALATVRHECAGTYRPIEEYGRGKEHPYGVPASNGRTYYGRGYVQLTWASNYDKMGRALGVPLTEQPDLALVPDTAYRILSYGMRTGAFTGHTLARWISGSTCDYTNARRIINGLDRADVIAGYAIGFERALRAATVEDWRPAAEAASALGQSLAVAGLELHDDDEEPSA